LEQAIPYACEDFAKTDAPTSFGAVRVLTLSMNDVGASPKETGVLTYPSIVYSSTTALYVGATHWWYWPEPGQDNFTYFYRFDLTDPSKATFTGAGGAPGWVLNSFSVDEHEGYLRVATTLTHRVADPQFEWGRLDQTNRVSVLETEGETMEVVGQTPDIAPGESLFSARFMGKRGYLVTFRQIDPLHSLDLSNPRDPRVVGELSVPGFSTYLHPLDDTHLLAIGTYVPEMGANWQGRRLQLSMFDVTDPARPVRQFNELIGGWSSSSSAAYDHHAFNFFKERGLLAIPFTDYPPFELGANGWWSGLVSELRVFGVNTQTGFTPKGALKMADVYANAAQGSAVPWGYGWAPYIQRSIMADGFVYAISDAGIRVALADNLASLLATALFDPPAQ